MSFFGPYDAFDSAPNFGALATLRWIIPAVKLSGSLSKVIVSFGHWSADYTINEAWIGHAAAAGDPYDFNGDQAQLLFSGSPSVTIVSGGVLSDVCTVSLSDASPIILSLRWGAFWSVPRLTTEPGFLFYYKIGVDEAGQTNVTGYSTWSYGSVLSFINEILSGTNFKLSGSVKALGIATECPVRCYIRSTGALYDSTTSNPDGSFELKAPDEVTPMVVLAFPDFTAGSDYNVLVFDRVTGLEE